MSTNIKTPPSLSKCSSYETWLKEIKIWQTFTELDIKKQGPAIFLTLEGRAREAVLELEVDKISDAAGVSNIIAKLDTLFLKDKTQSAFEAYDSFERFRRPKDMSMTDYINEFERLKAKIESYKSSLSTDVLAYRLLKSANLSETHEQLAKATISELTYECMKTQLKKIFGDVSQEKSSGNDLGAVKQEPLFNDADMQDSYYGYGNKGGRQPNYWRKNKQATWNNKKPQERAFPKDKEKKGRNPLKKNGEISRCVICDSFNHWASNCPDAVYYQTQNGSSSGDDSVSEETHQITLFQSNLVIEDQLNVFVSETLNTAVLDSGATANVAGKTWMNCYLGSLSDADKSLVNYSHSTNSFKFGSDQVFNSLYKVKFPASIGSQNLFIETDVINTNVPLLLSKRAMKTADTSIDFVDDTVIMFGEKQNVILTKSGHYSVPLDKKQKILSDAAKNSTKIVLLTSKEDCKDKNKMASKLHSQFAHPSAEKLIKLISAAGMGDDVALIKAIKDVTYKCDICRSYRKSAAKPIVSMPLANEFNEVVAMDLKFYRGKIILHLIDHVSRFSAAAIVSSKKPNEIIAKIFQVWISVFGPPKRFLHDNGGEFVNSDFLDLCDSFNIVILTTAAESPWSNRLCERHNAVLADMLDKILEERECDFQTALCWAIHAKNSLANVHGFSPYQLAIGLTPRMPNVLSDSPPALEESENSLVIKNLKAIASARKAYMESESKEKIRRALRHNIRTTNDHRYVSGDIVFYKRKDSKKWKGPARVLGTDSQQVLLKHGGIYVRVHSCRVMLKPSADEISDVENHQLGSSSEPVNKSVDHHDFTLSSESDDNEDSQTEKSAGEVEEDDTKSSDGDTPSNRNQASAIKDFCTTQPLKPGCLIEYKLTNQNAWKQATVLSRAGKATGKYRHCWNIKDKDDNISEIDTQTVEWKHVHSEDSLFENDVVQNHNLMSQNDEITMCESYISEVDRAAEEAKQRELENWIKENVYEVVEDVGQDTISVRWVMSPKVVDGKVITKARLVARGFQENVDDLRTDSPTCMKETLRLLFMTASSMKWSINSIDIKAAFLQGKSIDRELFLKPPKEADSKGSLWKLKKAVYGLSDASRVWYLRVVDELTKLRANISTFDKALFMWKSDGRLQGLIAVHVDDFIWCGTENFKANVINPLRNSFKISKENAGAFRYLGIDLRQTNDHLSLDQNSYIDSVQPIPLPKSVDRDSPVDSDNRTMYKGLVGQISWASATSRPDLSFESCILSTQQSKPTGRDLFEANKALKDLKNNKFALKYSSLNLDSAKIVVFCDASYGNLADGSSQGGHIVFMSDETGTCSPINWSSRKLKRVVRSTLAAETLAAVESLDSAYLVGNLFAEIFSETKMREIEIHTDNRSLYDTVRTSNVPEDKRLRIDIAALRETLEKDGVTFKWISGNKQLANALTKKGASKQLLRNVLTVAHLGG